MVLYFPVSALVTLFGNILQNPLDPRARSDTRLMNLVVTFLSMLGQEAESGGVHRMLSVCSEFERISKVIIEKVEKENSGRRKRKVADSSSNTHSTSSSARAATSSTSVPAAVSSTLSQASHTPRPQTATTTTPTPNHTASSRAATPSNHMTPSTRATTTNGQLSPPLPRDTAQSVYTPMGSTMSHSPSPGLTPAGWSDYPMGGADGTDFPSFADLTGFGAVATGPNGMRSPPTANGVYQQPMLPQDLFSLTATLDWDWAEMSGGAYPSVENGNFDDGPR